MAVREAKPARPAKAATKPVRPATKDDHEQRRFRSMLTDLRKNVDQLSANADLLLKRLS